MEVSCADFQHTHSNGTSKLLYEFCVLSSFNGLYHKVGNIVVSRNVVEGEVFSQ